MSYSYVLIPSVTATIISIELKRPIDTHLALVGTNMWVWFIGISIAKRAVFPLRLPILREITANMTLFFCIF
jgi:hypothetical protein